MGNKIKDAPGRSKKDWAGLFLPLNIIRRYFHTPSIRSSKRIGPHNIDIISILVGSLLSEGYSSFRKNAKSQDGIRFTFKQSIIHKEYLEWLYNYLSRRGYCNAKTKPREQIVISRGKKYIRYTFTTFTFRSLKWLNKLFYKKGHKYINSSISNYLTPLALAVWIMDDGGKMFNAGLKLSTNCFT